MIAAGKRGALLLAPARPAGGFTLIELIIVMLIIGLAAGLTGIAITRDSGARELKLLTRNVSSVLRYARNRAVTGKKIYRFVIDDEKNMFHLYVEDADHKEQKLVMEKDIHKLLAMSLKDSDDELPHIDFFPRGDSSGGVLLIQRDNGAGNALTINRITGKVDIEEIQ